MEEFKVYMKNNQKVLGQGVVEVVAGGWVVHGAGGRWKHRKPLRTQGTFYEN